tara:strand:+ start:108 stop:284 length:177 start_codon:yes stop_codon:yes gene_type:complete
MTYEEKLNHMIALKEEVRHLRTLLRPEDTGHIHTTISTLEERIKGLHKEVYGSKGRNA